MANTPVGVSSATYRTAVNNIARAIKRKPQHTQYPSDDLVAMIAKIPQAFHQEVIKWYELGVKRGMNKATDLMADGEIYKEGDTVYAPDEMTVNVRLKISGRPWKKIEIKVRPKDIGFK